MLNKKILFIFISGRKEKVLNPNLPEEFLYGYNSIKSINPETEYIEFKSNQGKLLKFLSLFLRKISGLPIFFEYLMDLSYLKKFYSSDIIICTNQRVGFSYLIFHLFINIFKKKKLIIFIMGLLDVKHKSKLKNKFRNSLIKLLFFTSTKLIFLGKKEYNFACANYSEYLAKLEFLPFGVDLNFWEFKNLENQRSKSILFIGNDGKRDFKFLEEIISKLPELEFNVLSKKTNHLKKYENVVLHNGSLNTEELSDYDVRQLYYNSTLTILPIQDTLQPSGQSVGLQSIACGTPVLISKYKGFWDESNFINNKNIFFESNDIESWINKIKLIFENQLLLNSVSKNGIKTIEENYSSKLFNNRLINIIKKVIF